MANFWEKPIQAQLGGNEQRCSNESRLRLPSALAWSQPGTLFNEESYSLEPFDDSHPSFFFYFA